MKDEHQPREAPLLAAQATTYHHSILELAYQRRKFSLGEHSFAATLFGNKGGVNWSVSQLASSGYAHMLGAALRALGVGKAMLCDTTQFNAVVLDAKDFTRRHQLPNHLLWLAHEPAEGVMLGPSHTSVQSPGGCHTPIAARPGFDPVVAHMGRWSLINKNARYGHSRSDNNPDNICLAMLAKLGVHRSKKDASEVHIKILWGIPPRRFPHPLTGQHEVPNRWLLSHIKHHWGEDCVIEEDGVFYPNLALIAKTEFEDRGVLPENIDLDDCELPRNEAYMDGRAGQPRNLVVIQCLT